jgi:Tfp pilus assembly protein PilP
MRFLSKAAVLLAVLVCLGACGRNQAAAEKKVEPEKDKAFTVEQLLGGALPQGLKVQDDGFVYERKGLRDPFQPFIRLSDKKKEKGGRPPKILVPKTPLQKFPLEDLKLVGVVWADAGRSKALIEDPKGKGYYVGVGTWVGDRGGKIVRIHPDKVVVEERMTDVLGEENVNQITLTLHKAEDEVSP